MVPTKLMILLVVLGAMSVYVMPKLREDAAAPGTPLSAAQIMTPFADIGSPQRIRAVKAALRDALREADTPLGKRRVTAWQGAFVEGRKASVLVDLRVVERDRPKGAARISEQRRSFALLYSAGAWRITRER